MPILANSYNDYYVIHSLAVSFKNGKASCGIELIKHFKNILIDYSRLFKEGTTNISNYSVRTFLGYFGGDYSINKVLYSYKYNNLDLSKTKHVINFKSATKNMTCEDFNQELILALLKMAKRYDNNKPNFHTYVNKYFHYVLLERLKKEFKNASINNNIKEFDHNSKDEIFNIKFDMFIEDISLKEENKKALLNTEYNSLYSDDFIDTNWLLGNYKDSLFKDLSNEERNIIKLCYIDKKNDSEIARMYGVCRATINRKRLKIVKNIEYIEK